MSLIFWRAFNVVGQRCDLSFNVGRRGPRQWGHQGRNFRSGGEALDIYLFIVVVVAAPLLGWAAGCGYGGRGWSGVDDRGCRFAE